MPKALPLLKRLAPDLWSAGAFAACLIPLSVLLLGGDWPPWNPEAEPAEIAALLLLSALTLPLAAIVMGFPQILMAVLVRRVRAPAAKAIGALASLGLSVWYVIWALGADLTSSSTAPIALIFYPIMVQGWAWLAAFAAILFAHLYPRTPE